MGSFARKSAATESTATGSCEAMTLAVYEPSNGACSHVQFAGVMATVFSEGHSIASSRYSTVLPPNCSCPMRSTSGLQMPIWFFVRYGCRPACCGARSGFSFTMVPKWFFAHNVTP